MATVENFGTSQKTLKAYVIGLVLCIILTLTSFALVASHAFSHTFLYVGLSILAIVQLIVQVACFLRLNNSPEGRWNLMPFLFAIVLVAILIGGSLWIMYNMNLNMM